MAHTGWRFQRLTVHKIAWGLKHKYGEGTKAPEKCRASIFGSNENWAIRYREADENGFLGANNSIRRLKMMFRKAKIACVLAVCLGLAVSSVSVLAQKSSPTPPEKINLNTASVEQLQSLPGVGAATAKSIVEYRAKVGKFKRIEEIINIKGIGEKKFERIKDRLII
jgi:comEA protein